jgi:hypothetical protein
MLAHMTTGEAGPSGVENRAETGGGLPGDSRNAQ